MDEGFFVIDVIFNKENQPVDLFYVEANPASVKIVGGDWSGKHLTEISLNYEKYWFEIFGRVALTGKSVRLERYAEPDKKWYSFYVFKIGGMDSRRVGNTFLDITERKKAEEALKASEARLSSVFENSMDAILLTAPDGRIFRANPAAQRMLGMTEQEIIEAGRQGIVVDDERLAKALEERNETGRTNAEITLRRKDGSALSIEATSSLFIDSDGSTKTSMIIRDITERKKAEEALRESEILYRTILDNSEDGFQLVKPLFDKEGNPIDYLFLKVNQAYERQVGLKAEQVVGKTVREIVPNIEHEWIETHGQVAKTGKTLHREIYNDFSKRWYDLYYFKYKEGQVGVLFRDITARKSLEKSLQEQERLAAIGATAGMVGHDIRNPLQAIAGDVYLLRDYLSGMPDTISVKHEVAESLEEIEKNVGYINKIVADLQDYSRTIKPELSNLNLYELVTVAFRSIGIPENVKPIIEIDSKINLKTDATLLTRILTNLIINAIQAMPSGGKLSIVAIQTQDSLVLSVQDTGVGIPEHIKPKLFTPMMTTKSKGQGLGLAVVKRLVDALKGIITFESQEGKGTKFIIEIPNNK
jgi:PAS domain S-box-containing protein